MQRAANLIKAHKEAFPDCAYYLPLLSKARRNARAHPDICIETCKALLEGIAKTIVLDLDAAATKELVDKKDVDQIVKWAAKMLQQNDEGSGFEAFWSEQREGELVALCEQEGLKREAVEEMIRQYHFTHRLPLREKVVAALETRPKILERKSIVERVTRRLLSLIETFDDN